MWTTGPNCRNRSCHCSLSPFLQQGQQPTRTVLTLKTKCDPLLGQSLVEKDIAHSFARTPILRPVSATSALPRPAGAHQFPEGRRRPPADGALIGRYDDAALPENRQMLSSPPRDQTPSVLTRPPHANSDREGPRACRSIPNPGPHHPSLSWGSQREILWDGGHKDQQAIAWNKLTRTHAHLSPLSTG